MKAHLNISLTQTRSPLQSGESLHHVDSRRTPPAPVSTVCISDSTVLFICSVGYNKIPNMTSTPFAHHPDVRESIRLTIARAQTLGPSLDLRRQALTLRSMPWIIMAPNSSTSYKDWATYKLEEYRERNAESVSLAIWPLTRDIS